MEIEELLQRIQNIERIQALAHRPAPEDPHGEMDGLQKSAFIDFLQDQLREKDHQMEELLLRVEDIQKKLDEALAIISNNNKAAEELHNTILELKATICMLERDKQTLTDQLELLKNDHYGSKSLKGKPAKKARKQKEDDEDNDTSTPSADGSETAQTAELQNTTEEEAKPTCNHGPSREGWIYDKQDISNAIKHECDLSKLPQGAEIIGKPKCFVVRHRREILETHAFMLVTYKTSDGELHEDYFPYDGDKTGAEVYDDILPGTHVTISLESHNLQQHYVLGTPIYRLAKNLYDKINWFPHRQNLVNWEDKSASFLQLLLPELKKMALADGANLNIDETWHRYQTHFGHEKVYVWCLVNRAAKTVIFFFGDAVDEKGKTVKVGSRRTAVLREFLESAHLQSLQSDGYVSYVNIEDEMVNTEHLCCLAHSRARFWKALQQGCKIAEFFIDKIKLLYAFETQYKKEGLDAATIKARRNGEETTSIIQEIRMKLLELQAQIHQAPESLSELMKDAIGYMFNRWKELFAYRNNGDYTIDNLAVEREIKPLANQRKNSLFYCSSKGAQNAALFNTFAATCRQVGISFEQYFQTVVRAIKSGRTDYKNLLPSTIEL